jgi:hypothetical protein
MLGWFDTRLVLFGPSLELRVFEVQNDSQDRFAARGGHLSPSS